MYRFSNDEAEDQNIGELVFESLLNSNVESIIDLNLGSNSSWFDYPGNVDLLTEFISRQNCLKIISLSDNSFSSIATFTLLTKIAEIIKSIKLTTLDLASSANFEADDTVEKLANIL